MWGEGPREGTRVWLGARRVPRHVWSVRTAVHGRHGVLRTDTAGLRELRWLAARAPAHAARGRPSAKDARSCERDGPQPLRGSGAHVAWRETAATRDVLVTIKGHGFSGDGSARRPGGRARQVSLPPARDPATSFTSNLVQVICQHSFPDSALLLRRLPALPAPPAPHPPVSVLCATKRVHVSPIKPGSLPGRSEAHKTSQTTTVAVFPRADSHPR